MRQRRSRRVLFIQYTAPAILPPLEHSASLLGEQGWKIWFVGIRGEGDAVAVTLPRSLPARQLLIPKLCSGALRHLVFCASAVAWFVVWRPDIVIASDLRAVLPAAAVQLLGGRVVYHEHDSPAAVSTSRVGRLLLRTRARVARHALAVVVPNAARAAELKETSATAACLIHVAWNCPRQAEADWFARKAPRSEHDQFVIHYHGSIVPARIPLTLFDALSRLDDRFILSIHGFETVGHPGYIEQCLTRSADRGLNGRVKFHGAAPRKSVIAAARHADLGWAAVSDTSVDQNLERLLGASVKVFEYFAAGLPAVVHCEPQWRSTFVGEGFAFECEPRSVDSIADALRRAASDPERCRAMGEAARCRVIAQWNYDRQYSPIVGIMTDASRDRPQFGSRWRERSSAHQPSPPPHGRR